MCDEEFWNDESVSFMVFDELRDHTPIDPTEITFLEDFTSVDPLGRHVITVAAYNDTDGHSSNANHHHVAVFSSRGPLRDYSDPANPVTPIPKPDIAAPGVRIDSAHGRDTKEGLVWHLPSWWDGDRFHNLDGTSMAAPFITGVVALLLEKNPSLSVSDVRTRLAHAPRAAVNPSTAPASTNAYGVGMVDALDSHNQP
jgi:subtilisin family serine protease